MADQSPASSRKRKPPALAGGRSHLPLNERKKENTPDTPATVLNRWWSTDYETPRQRRPHRDWPDIIDFTGKEYGAKVVWFGGKLEKWNPTDF